MGSRDWQRIAYEAEKSRDNAIAQLEYEQANRRKSDMEIAHERDDFIKELETASTVMRSALVAIQELHKPVWPVFSWGEGLKLHDPCPTCHGKAGVHECGCWADEDIQYVCAECSDFETGKGKRVTYPCPTRRLADDALGGGQDDGL